MTSAYRTAIIPRWVWVILAVSVLLIVLIVLSMAASGGSRTTVVSGPPVQTGDPKDYITAPPSSSVTTPEPTPEIPPNGTSADQPATPRTPPTLPAGLPQTFEFDGRTWQATGKPVTLDVQTTGEYTDDNIIYAKPGDEPPYDALYLETAPNSGRFYKYVPAQTGD